MGEDRAWPGVATAAVYHRWSPQCTCWEEMEPTNGATRGPPSTADILTACARCTAALAHAVPAGSLLACPKCACAKTHHLLPGGLRTVFASVQPGLTFPVASNAFAELLRVICSVLYAQLRERESSVGARQARWERRRDPAETTTCLGLTRPTRAAVHAASPANSTKQNSASSR